MPQFLWHVVNPASVDKGCAIIFLSVKPFVRKVPLYFVTWLKVSMKNLNSFYNSRSDTLSTESTCLCITYFCGFDTAGYASFLHQKPIMGPASSATGSECLVWGQELQLI